MPAQGSMGILITGGQGRLRKATYRNVCVADTARHNWGWRKTSPMTMTAPLLLDVQGHSAWTRGTELTDELKHRASFALSTPPSWRRGSCT
jgi:hypothetical protein